MSMDAPDLIPSLNSEPQQQFSKSKKRPHSPITHSKLTSKHKDPQSKPNIIQPPSSTQLGEVILNHDNQSD